MFTTPRSSRIPHLCSHCRKHSRRNASSATPKSAIAHLPSRRLLSLHGPDSPKFLQGLLTANISPTTRNGLYAAFLNGQGRVLNDVFVYPTLGSRWHRSYYGSGDEETGFLVEVDGRQVEDLFKHLKRHKLRSKFEVRVVGEGEVGVWSSWREGQWEAHTFDVGEGDGRVRMKDLRAPGMGERLLLPAGESAEGHLEVVDEEIYRARRYLKGIPEGQEEIIREEALPMNCNIDIMGGIDFKKGCYIGQELTIRTHHTGVVRRRILPVMLYERGTEPPSQLVYDPSTTFAKVEHDAEIRRDDVRKRATGKFIAGIGNIGLATCRLEQMSDLKVSGEGSSFSPDDRFLVQATDGREVGVKAFVPDWLRGTIREPKIQKRVT